MSVLIMEKVADRIVREYLSGVRVSELLRRYGISTSTLYRLLRSRGVRLRQEGVVRRRLTEEERRAIIKLYREGKGLSEIAHAIGCSRMTVYRVLRSAGLLGYHENQITS